MGGARGAHGCADPAGDGDVVVLDQDRRGQIGAVVRAPAAGDRELVQAAQAGRGLAGIEDLDAGSGDSGHVSAGGRGDPGHALQEVDGGALGGEQRPRRPLDPGDGLRRLRDVPAVGEEHLHLGVRVEPQHHLAGDLEAADDARLADDDVGDRHELRRHRGVGRRVAAARILVERAVDHTIE